MTAAPDPYRTLGVSAGVSDDELRAAYRRAVLRFHPDHNGGSAESTRRFEEVQEAYARIRRLRERPRVQSAEPDPGVQARLAEMERELAAERRAREAEAKRARERERRAAQERQRIREQARRAADDATGPGAAFGRGTRLRQDRRQLLEDLRRRRVRGFGSAVRARAPRAQAHLRSDRRARVKARRRASRALTARQCSAASPPER